VSRELPSFDLIVATVGRTEELARLLDSIAAQSYPATRVIVVDQNDDDEAAALLASSDIRIRHVRSARGLARARNAGLALVEADVVAFPDDDCTYPNGLLAEVAGRLAADATLDGLSGRIEDASGVSSQSWAPQPAVLDRDNVWNRVNSAATFLRRRVVEGVGAFDEQLGLGSGRRWSSGEEVDYLIRAVDGGARIEYDPSLVVTHRLVPDDTAIGYRDGATVGYLLRKHGYSRRAVARMLARPLGGAALALLRLDPSRSRYYAATLRGRLRGYVGTSRANSSA
jgi:glycosyltransferase involved in cell wall biosynthesis